LIRLFLASFLTGALLTALAAHFYPLPQAPRAYSQAEVLANGGREEAFFIRLPEDRVGDPRAAATAPFPQQTFAADGQERIVAELFRLRDAGGNLIGLASRMNGMVAGEDGLAQPVTDWMLLIPGRGALMMGRGAVATGSAPEFYVDRLGFSFVNSGPIISGSGEFAGLTGFYGEETEIDKVDSDGQAFGQVKLTTRLQAGAQ
jgi:hypothetical protein